jgi:hypothetical protein
MFCGKNRNICRTKQVFSQKSLNALTDFCPKSLNTLTDATASK